MNFTPEWKRDLDLLEEDYKKHNTISKILASIWMFWLFGSIFLADFLTKFFTGNGFYVVLTWLFLVFSPLLLIPRSKYLPDSEKLSSLLFDIGLAIEKFAENNREEYQKNLKNKIKKLDELLEYNLESLDDIIFSNASKDALLKLQKSMRRFYTVVSNSNFSNSKNLSNSLIDLSEEIYKNKNNLSKKAVDLVSELYLLSEKFEETVLKETIMIKIEKFVQKFNSLHYILKTVSVSLIVLLLIWGILPIVIDITNDAKLTIFVAIIIFFIGRFFPRQIKNK